MYNMNEKGFLIGILSENEVYLHKASFWVGRGE